MNECKRCAQEDDKCADHEWEAIEALLIEKGYIVERVIEL